MEKIKLYLNKGENNVVHCAKQDEYLAVGDYGNNENVKIVLEEESQIDYFFDYKPKNNNKNFSFVAEVKRNSVLQMIFCITNAADIKISIALYLEEGSKADILGFYYLKNNEICTINVTQHHKKVHSQSKTILHGVLCDTSHVSYEGSIIIDQKAKNAHAEQFNKNIILSPQARAVSIPNLEVHSNGVVCKHGSATGKCDAESLFYAQSRGLAMPDSQRLVLNGFLQEPFKYINNQTFGNFVKEKITSALKNLH